MQSEEKRIEDCTLISDNNDRLSCFDSFFQTDKKQIPTGALSELPTSRAKKK